MSIKNNIEKIKNEIINNSNIVNRNPNEIKLIAVTKSASIDEIIELINLGINIIAESRVKRAKEIFEKLPKNIEKHMIGHLQTNKVKSAVEIFDVIQSVDSLKLVKEIDKKAFEIGKVIDIMIQLNISKEEQKFGFNIDNIYENYNKMLTFTNIKVIGLMAMAPFIEKEKTRPYFKIAKHVFDKLKLKELSIGMSNDFDIAIQEGATIIRVGRKLFNN
jgi:PLP dependent protein